MGEIPGAVWTAIARRRRLWAEIVTDGGATAGRSMASVSNFRTGLAQRDLPEWPGPPHPLVR
ncbi:hypothetical protein [Streptomyces sp. NPDC098101]|uniref:hypothetical protein n=1 Tax=Streptomyces sp. NPDC098101 TaxID=3366096 RepID=UPI00383020E0